MIRIVLITFFFGVIGVKAQSHVSITYQCDSNNVLQSHFSIAERYKEYTDSMIINNAQDELIYKGKIPQNPIALQNGVYKITTYMFQNEKMKYQDENYILVPKQAKAIIELDKTTVCLGFPVVFTNKSIGDSIVCQFEWGDNSAPQKVRKGEQRVHSFNPPHDVCQQTLEITDVYGCKSDAIALVSVMDDNLDYNIISDQAVEVSKPIKLEIENSGNASPIERCKWSTGDTTQSIKVLEEGNYQVKIEDKYGCKKTLTREIICTDKIIAKIEKETYNEETKRIIVQATAVKGAVYIWQIKKCKHRQTIKSTSQIEIWGKRRVRVAAYKLEQGKIGNYIFSDWHLVKKATD